MEWQAFELLEPFGPEREDFRTGAIVNVLMNANRNSKKRPQPFTLLECTPMFGDATRPTKSPMPWQKMKSLAQELTVASRQPSRGRKRGS